MGVLRFGLKGFAKYQQSYGPTKLELQGIVPAVLDCVSYIRGCTVLSNAIIKPLSHLSKNNLKVKFTRPDSDTEDDISFPFRFTSENAQKLFSKFLWFCLLQLLWDKH